MAKAAALPLSWSTAHTYSRSLVFIHPECVQLLMCELGDKKASDRPPTEFHCVPEE